MNRALWVVQGLLALLYLYTGVSKLVLPVAVMLAMMPVPLPGAYLRFVGICELLGAAGLILPGLLRTSRNLTPLAAAGLLIIMIGATTVSLMGHQYVGSLLPLVTGLLVAFVLYGRRAYLPRLTNMKWQLTN